jgi:hypothetical protein
MSAPTYEIRDGVVSRTVGDETVIIDLDRETHFGVNRVGSVIWAELEQGAHLPQIVAAIVDRFDVIAQRATTDIATLLADLERCGLIVRRM